LHKNALFLRKVKKKLGDGVQHPPETPSPTLPPIPYSQLLDPPLFLTIKPIWWRRSPFPKPSGGHQFTLPDHGHGASASRGVPVYVTAFAGSHSAYPRRDGQAELTWVAGYTPFTQSSKHRAIIEQTSSKLHSKYTCTTCAVIARCLLDDCLMV